jgi:hypothetical protein
LPGWYQNTGRSEQAMRLSLTEVRSASPADTEGRSTSTP